MSGVLHSTVEPQNSVLSREGSCRGLNLGQVLLQEVQLFLPVLIILFLLKNKAKLV